MEGERKGERKGREAGRKGEESVGFIKKGNTYFTMERSGEGPKRVKRA